MSVQAKVNYISQQRLDLQHMLANQSFTAFDFRTLTSILGGASNYYVAQGLEIQSVSGLSVSIKTADSLLLTPTDDAACFLSTGPDQVAENLILPANAPTIFVEAYFEATTKTPVTTAIFDTGAISTTTPAGSEFSTTVDFEKTINIRFRYSVSGFSPDSIPLAKCSTNSTTLTAITDERLTLFRLGRGSDQFYEYKWSNNREENQIPGNPLFLGVQSTLNPYYTNDANGAKNDKAITNLKDWMDAVMTIIKEIKGTPFWYTSSLNKTVNNVLFLTSNATTINPNLSRTIRWSRNSSGVSDFKLRSLEISSGSEPASWAMNFGYVKWYLGGTFTSLTQRLYSNKDFEANVLDGRALFIKLDREITPPTSSGNAVKWGTESAHISLTPPFSVKGLEGDFTGVAIGDYIRKESQEYFEYVRVIGIVESESLINWNPITGLTGNFGKIASSICTGLQVEYAIATATVEPVKWFRTAYANDDIFYSTVDGQQVTSVSGFLTIDIDDINLYWIGKRLGNTFLMRDYGNLSIGEDIQILEDSDQASVRYSPNFFLKLDNGVEYDGIDLKSLNSNIISLQKMRFDNTINAGSGNTDAWQTYNLDTTTSISSDGDGLWLRLDDYTSASPIVLSAGTVDPSEPTTPMLNVYEVIPSSNNPIRSFRNRNCFLLARKLTIDGIPTIQFFDGQSVQFDGVSLNKDITRISTVSTDPVLTTVVAHGFMRNTINFIWEARITSTGESVGIGATQTSTGLILKNTPSGAESLTIVFTRHIP